MSFDQLPNETLQLVVDKCAEADQAYRAGNNGEEIKGGKKQVVDVWKGRNLMAISLVSKTLRSMSVKYIFESLVVSKAESDTFQYYILGSPTARCITKVVFATNSSKPRLSASLLLRVVLQVLPQLPNIKSIEGLSSLYLKTLIGGGGLAQPSNPAKQEMKQIRALKEEEFEAIVNANVSGIKKLRLVSSKLFSSASFRFPTILSPLSNLESLSLQQKLSTPYGADPVHIEESVFATPFSFAHGLRTLDLSFTGYSDQTITTDLNFASRFPSIRRLVINADNRNPWETSGQETFHFLHLEYLEIKKIHECAISLVLNDLDLPAILELRFNFLTADTFETAKTGENLCLPFTPFPTLRKVAISNTQGLHNSFPHRFAISLPSVTLQIDSSTRLSLDLVSPAQTHPSSSSNPSTSPSRDPFFERTTELLNWAREKAEIYLKTENLVGSKELLEALETVEKLRYWLET